MNRENDIRIGRNGEPRHPKPAAPPAPPQRADRVQPFRQELQQALEHIERAKGHNRDRHGRIETAEHLGAAEGRLRMALAILDAAMGE